MEIVYGDGKPKAVGTWDFFGACAPNQGESLGLWKTFTLGIFQWLPANRGTKRGKVVRRVKGFTHNPKEAFDLAISIVGRKEQGDAGMTEPTKFIIMYYTNGLWIVALVDTSGKAPNYHKSFTDKNSAMAFVSMTAESLEDKK